MFNENSRPAEHVSFLYVSTKNLSKRSSFFCVHRSNRFAILVNAVERFSLFKFFTSNLKYLFETLSPDLTSQLSRQSNRESKFSHSCQVYLTIPVVDTASTSARTIESFSVLSFLVATSSAYERTCTCCLDRSQHVVTRVVLRRERIVSSRSYLFDSYPKSLVMYQDKEEEGVVGPQFLSSPYCFSLE